MDNNLKKLMDEINLVRNELEEIDKQIINAGNNIQTLSQKRIELNEKLEKCKNDIKQMTLLEKNKKTIDSKLHQDMDDIMVSLLSLKNNLTGNLIRTKMDIEDNKKIYNDLIEKRRPIAFKLNLLEGTEKYFIGIFGSEDAQINQLKK